jgi:hypothetical protein
MPDNQAFAASDLQSVAAKLAEFSKTLTPGERLALMDQFKQTPSDEDVQGYQYNLMQQSLAEAHRQQLLREAEQERLAASALPARRPNILRVAVGRMGTALVGAGTWMKQVEMPREAATGTLQS